MKCLYSLPILLLSAALFSACQKVDFGDDGGITERDSTGRPTGHVDESDWSSDAKWKKQELDLFKDLNIDLNGTQLGGVRNMILYPNPGAGSRALNIQQTGSATQFASVVVDRKYKVVRELLKDAPVYANGTDYALDFSSLKKGETYRMYYVFLEHESRQVWGVLQDVKGMYAASGVLTQAGGLTSHAGAVARELGKPCVTACTGLVVHADKKTAELNGLQLSEGDTISINGTSGEVMLGPVKLSPPKLKGKLLRFMSWVEQYCGHLRPMALVNSPQEAQLVRPLPA